MQLYDFDDTDDETLNEILHMDENIENEFVPINCGFEHAATIRCAAHTLQLAVLDAIKRSNEKTELIINLCRAVAKQLRIQSNIHILSTHKINSIRPRQEGQTRWSSIFFMVCNFHETNQ